MDAQWRFRGLAATMSTAESVVVLDFETTGLSPGQGDRAIEIGAVRVVEGRVVARFQRLMNPGFRVSPFIESYTGISNEMLRDAPPCAEVIREFAGFIEGHRLVAHNAAFDRRFLEAELDAIGLAPHAEAFACSMRIARRIYPQAPNHKLATLVDYRGLARKGAFHRALADAEMTAQLWLGMLSEVAQRAGRSLVPFGLMQRLEETPKRAVDALLADWVDPA